MPDTPYTLTDIASKIEAAEAFVKGWGYLAIDLHTSYDCTMTCGEAEALADLFIAFGQEETAAEVLRLHTESDEPGDAHYSGPEDGKVMNLEFPGMTEAVRVTVQGEAEEPGYWWVAQDGDEPHKVHQSRLSV